MKRLWDTGIRDIGKKHTDQCLCGYSVLESVSSYIVKALCSTANEYLNIHFVPQHDNLRERCCHRFAAWDQGCCDPCIRHSEDRPRARWSACRDITQVCFSRSRADSETGGDWICKIIAENSQRENYAACSQSPCTWFAGRRYFDIGRINKFQSCYFNSGIDFCVTKRPAIKR